MAAGTLASLWSKKLKGRPEVHDADDGSQKRIMKKEAQNVQEGPIAKQREEKKRQSPNLDAQSERQDQEGTALTTQGKKRKRTKFSVEEVEKLRTVFLRTTHPSKAERQLLAKETGLDTTQVLGWFESQRRKLARHAKDLDKSKAAAQNLTEGEPAGGSVIDLEEEEEEDGVLLLQTPLPELSSQAKADSLMAVADSGQAAPMQDFSPQPMEAEQAEVSSQQLGTHAGLEAAVRAGGGVADPGEGGGNIHPRVAVCGGDETQAATQEAGACTPAEAAAAVTSPEGRGMGSQEQQPLATKPIPPRTWSSQELRVVGAKLEAQAGQVVQYLRDAQPLQPLPDEPLTSVCKPQIASFLAGCSLTLDQLLDALQCEGVEREALRDCILDLATRKSFAVKEGGNADELIDFLNNQDAERLWRWELRNLLSLPKPLQPKAKLLKKNLHEASALLAAVTAARTAVGATGSRAKCKAEKALARLQKLPVPEELHSALQQDSAQNAAQNPAETLQPQQKAAVSDVEPAEIAAEKVAAERRAEAKKLAKDTERDRVKREKERLRKEKEDQRKEKEEQKVKARREKEAQKEQQRLEKEQQRLDKEKEKEQQRLEKQQKHTRRLKPELAAFGSAKTIAKSRSAFTSFFKKTPAAGRMSQAMTAVTPRTGSPIKIRALDDAFSPAEQDACREAVAEEAVAARLDEELGKPKSPEAAQGSTQELLRRWKYLPRHRRVKGLPPSWARRPSAAPAALEAGNEDEDDDVSCTLWRRKFLWFPTVVGGDGLGYPQPHWPPYYGSWSKTSDAVKPRRPFAKDPALDYEVMEDEEWEPEPDGDSLSNDEAEDEEPCGEESGNDGFFVADGQLSEDEGLSSVQQDIDMLCAEQEDDAASVPLAELARPDNAAGNAQRRVLEEALRKACPRPLIVSRLKPDPLGNIGCLSGDPLLLSAFSKQVVTATVMVTLPAAGTEPEASHRGSAAAQGGERPDELVPELVTFLKAHPEIKAVSKVVKAFCTAHAERKLVKKWVTDKVKELAEKTITGWRIKSEGPSEPPLQPSSQEPDAASQPGQQPSDAVLQPDVKPGALLKFLGKANEHGSSGSTGGPCTGNQPEKTVTSTSDPRWQSLVAALVQPAHSHSTSSVDRLFAVVGKVGSPAAIPDFVLAAMLKTLGSGAAAPLLREACARSLARLVAMMAEEDATIATPPHKVWGEAKSAPKAASLEHLMRDPQLRPMLLECLQNPVVDVARSAAMLIGALVRVGCPKKLSSSAAQAQSCDLPAATRLAAAALRSGLAGDANWLEVLTAGDGSNSQTLLSYRLLVLGYLLFDELSVDAVLSDGGCYSRVLDRLLAAATLQNVGCAKYGMLGLLYVLRWHAASKTPFPGAGAHLERLLAVTAQKLQEKQQALLCKGAEPDETTLAAFEVARVLGEVQVSSGCPVAADSGKGAAELSNRNDLVAVLVALKHGEGLVTRSAATRAWDALMQRGREAEEAAPMDTS